MRITRNQLWDDLTARIHNATRRLADAQEKITTGRRVNRPSDDPSAASRIIGLRAEVDRLASFKMNAEEAQGRLDTSAAILTSFSELLGEARAMGEWGSTGTLNETDRETVARDLDSLLNRALALANTKLGRRYLFAGSAATGSPYVRDEVTGRIEYRGSLEETRIPLGPGLTAKADLPGPQIFGGSRRGETRFDGSTGAAPGAGTDSGRGTTTLTLRHTATTTGDAAGPGGRDSASGVGVGASSASGDTILGDHTLTVVVAGDGSGGTVALDGGTAVSFTTSGATDVRVTNGAGDAVHLDLTGVTAGFSGDVTLRGQGTLSTDGGATEVAIDFTETQVVTDSRTGEVTHIDSRNVERTGVERVDYQGTFDVFAALEALRDELRNVDGRDAADLSDAISRRVDAVIQAHDEVLLALGTVGSRSARMAVSATQLDDLGFQLQRLRSELEDVDIAQAAVELTEQENAYQAALAVGARLARPTLLDYL